MDKQCEGAADTPPAVRRPPDQGGPSPLTPGVTRVFAANRRETQPRETRSELLAVQSEFIFFNQKIPGLIAKYHCRRAEFFKAGGWGKYHLIRGACLFIVALIMNMKMNMSSDLVEIMTFCETCGISIAQFTH